MPLYLSFPAWVHPSGTRNKLFLSIQSVASKLTLSEMKWIRWKTLQYTWKKRRGASWIDIWENLPLLTTRFPWERSKMALTMGNQKTWLWFSLSRRQMFERSEIGYWEMKFKILHRNIYIDLYLPALLRQLSRLLFWDQCTTIC